ncbi:MAG: hypothetical protein HZB61_10795 [Nitrospirae bacterium]|nr:hypothetical protein [Nitrospirota bacterium]
MAKSYQIIFFVLLFLFPSSSFALVHCEGDSWDYQGAVLSWLSSHFPSITEVDHLYYYWNTGFTTRETVGSPGPYTCQDASLVSSPPCETFYRANDWWEYCPTGDIIGYATEFRHCGNQEYIGGALVCTEWIYTNYVQARFLMVLTNSSGLSWPLNCPVCDEGNYHWDENSCDCAPCPSIIGSEYEPYTYMQCEPDILPTYNINPFVSVAYAQEEFTPALYVAFDAVFYKPGYNLMIYKCDDSECVGKEIIPYQWGHDRFYVNTMYRLTPGYYFWSFSLNVDSECGDGAATLNKSEIVNLCYSEGACSDASFDSTSYDLFISDLVSRAPFSLLSAAYSFFDISGFQQASSEINFPYVGPVVLTFPDMAWFRVLILVFVIFMIVNSLIRRLL